MSDLAVVAICTQMSESIAGHELRERDGQTWPPVTDSTLQCREATVLRTKGAIKRDE